MPTAIEEIVLPKLSNEEIARYSRHLILPEVGMEGQQKLKAAKVLCVGTKEGPCSRCLYPEPPPPGLVPSCAEGGVLGILPGLVGVIQATETIKLILGIGEPLIGRLLLVDALGMSFRTLKLRKNPECPVCGPNPTVTELIDYDQFCGIAPPSRAGPLEAARDKAGWDPPVLDGIPQITVQELKRKLDAKEDVFVLDVREPHEYPIANLGAPLGPVGE